MAEKEDPELDGAQLMDAIKAIVPSLPGYANLSREYFKQLKSEGFEKKEALYLTAKFTESLIFGHGKS